MQKHRREKKTVKVLSKKTLLAAFAGLCVLAAGLVASCSNLGAGYDGSTNGAQNAGVQTAEGVLVAKVAMPNMPSIKRQKAARLNLRSLVSCRPRAQHSVLRPRFLLPRPHIQQAEPLTTQRPLATLPLRER